MSHKSGHPLRQLRNRTANAGQSRLGAGSGGERPKQIAFRAAYVDLAAGWSCDAIPARVGTMRHLNANGQSAIVIVDHGAGIRTTSGHVIVE